jgi:hypothetical protein
MSEPGPRVLLLYSILPFTELIYILVIFRLPARVPSDFLNVAPACLSFQQINGAATE